MRFQKYLCIMLPFLMLMSMNLSGQPGQLRQIDSLMKWANQTGAFNGNVLVSKGDKIIYNASFGFTDATKTGRLSPDYRFNIGSITKEFSGVALMQLKNQGKLRLGDKVSRFIPELPEWADTVSIENLLQYSSGLPAVNWKAIKGDRDLFEGLMQADTLQFRPGTRYDYNNNNVFLRHFIIERLSGMSYKAYAEKYLFQPCRMDSALMAPLAGEGNIAKGFNNDLVADKADVPVTGGTYLTTVDLLRWANSLHNGEVIDRRSLYELGQAFDGQKTQSALGKAEFRNDRLIRHVHDGRSGSFEAILVSDIEEAFTVILLGNNYNGKIFGLSDAIVAILKSRD